jgi:CheY-like chemotaxis protein
MLPKEWGCSSQEDAAPLFFATGNTMSESPAGSAGATVLVIEDDDAARVGLAALLHPYGYHVATAPTGQAALELLERDLRPSVILLDMIVPRIDGWQFMARRQKDKSLSSIPVVIMTGLGIACPEWASSLGAADLLRKPIEVETLLQTVRRLAG